MLKTGDIIYKVTLEGHDMPFVAVKKYKVGQRLSKIDGTEGGGYLLKLAVRADQYLYLGDYIEDVEETIANLGIRIYSDNYIYVFDEKDIPKARKTLLENKIANILIDYEKLLDALKTIQDECAKYKVCTDCPFFVQSDDNNCGILTRSPDNWKLKKVQVIRPINQ